MNSATLSKMSKIIKIVSRSSKMDYGGNVYSSPPTSAVACPGTLRKPPHFAPDVPRKVFFTRQMNVSKSGQPILDNCAKRSLLSGPSTGNSEICPFRRVAFRCFIITFHRGGNAAVDSVLVKYVIFEKISSDPRKYRCKVRLAIHNGHHRDPVLDVYFGDFLETYDKK